MLEPDDDRLDDEQQAAVEAKEPTIAVLAGPGSGKTRTLSYRTRHLLQGDPDGHALLLTFTNKAAAEMKARALRVGGLATNRIQASTFHGFGVRVLRNHGNLVGISPDFEILDREEQEDLAREIAREHGIRLRLKRWSYLRLRMLAAEPHVVEFSVAFEAAKRERDVVDYDDLVVYTAQLLNEYPAIAQAYGARYRHLLVDEFQDTNAVQFAIVQALCPNVETVSVFADDDQAIFGFAGADLENVGAFVDELGARVFPLTWNYRSREAIVAVANALIASDPNASGRQMRADESGGTVALLSFSTIEDEAYEICDEIEATIDAGDLSPSDIAVLVRSGYRAKAIVDELQRRELPMSDWRGPNYEPRERQTMATCLAVLRGRLNDRQADRLSELMGVDVIEERDTHQFLTEHAGNPVADGLSVVREMAFAGERPSVVAQAACDAIATVDAACASALGPLRKEVEHLEEYDPDFSLDDLLTELALGWAGAPPTEGGGVKVANLHRTKGLQWPHVYLLGLEEGHSPDRHEEDPDEERRLCFVGACRAEDVLKVTFAGEFMGHERIQSRFLREMGLM